MRWIKFGGFAIVLILALYAASTFWVKESETFTVEKDIAYPVDRVYPQFSNLQNFSRWNSLFTDSNLNISFFSPYEGQGSSLRYHDKKQDEVNGELFVRYANLNKTLRYQLYRSGIDKAFLIDVKFRPLGQKTQIIWKITTPPQAWYKSSFTLFSEDSVEENVDKSMKSLHALLGNKVLKEQQLENIKFDSLMVEKKEGQLLLGVNVTTRNNRDGIFKNIVVNHNKALNFIKMDLAKREDEYGEPVLITNADNYKDKEVSYFYGFPLSKRIAVYDNNFSFRTVNESTSYVIYHKGSFSSRIKSIQQLISKAKKDSMRTGDLHLTFLEEPSDENKTLIKLSLPVFR